MKKKASTSRSTSAATMVRRVNSTMKSEVIGLGSDPRFALARVPSGSLTIDRITGGGFPRGRHVELYGDYAAGKSLIMYLTMALAQQRGESVALLDPERVFDPEWFIFLGGDPSKLLIFRPRTAEEAIQVLMLFASTDDDNPGVDVVGIDSVAALIPQEELTKDPTEGEDRSASRARMMSRLLRRVTSVNDRTLFLWTNQLIDNVGGHGAPTTPGGRALKFYASIRIEMRKRDKRKRPRKRAKIGKLVSADVTVGQWVVVRAEKQKTGLPEMEGMFLFDYEQKKIDSEREIINLGLEDGLIIRNDNTFKFEDSDGKLWSGQEARFVKLLQDEPDMREELVWAINERSREIAAFVGYGSPTGEEDD